MYLGRTVEKTTPSRADRPIFCLTRFTDLYAIIYTIALANEQDKEQFLEEIDLMKQIGYHINVLGMIGFWTRSEPFLLLLEYVPCGNLLNWLREKRKQVRFAHVLTTDGSTVEPLQYGHLKDRAKYPYWRCYFDDVTSLSPLTV